MTLVLERALIFNKAQQNEFVNVFKMYIKGLRFPLQALVLEKRAVAVQQYRLISVETPPLSVCASVLLPAKPPGEIDA